MESTRDQTEARQASDFALIVFVATAVVVWADGGCAIDPAVQAWIDGLGVRGPEERPFLALAGGPDMWRRGVPATRHGMDDVRAAARMDLGVFNEGAAFLWPAPHLIRKAMAHFSIKDAGQVLVVGDDIRHEDAAFYVGAAYCSIDGFTGGL